jgi:hypothetical protein
VKLFRSKKPEEPLPSFGILEIGNTQAYYTVRERPIDIEGSGIYILTFYAEFNGQSVATAAEVTEECIFEDMCRNGMFSHMIDAFRRSMIQYETGFVIDFTNFFNTYLYSLYWNS